MDVSVKGKPQNTNPQPCNEASLKVKHVFQARWKRTEKSQKKPLCEAKEERCGVNDRYNKDKISVDPSTSRKTNAPSDRTWLW